MLLHFRLNNSPPSRTHGPLEQKLIPGSHYMTELPRNSPLTVISCQPVNRVLCWPHRIIFSVVPTPATLPKPVYWCLLFSFEWICSCYMWARCQMECEKALSNSGKVCWSDLPDWYAYGPKEKWNTGIPRNWAMQRTRTLLWPRSWGWRFYLAVTLVP